MAHHSTPPTSRGRAAKVGSWDWWPPDQSLLQLGCGLGERLQLTSQGLNLGARVYCDKLIEASFNIVVLTHPT
jgi:hypothetical protein